MANNYSSGEKIRLARQYLGLKQSDIVGGEITRNLISAVENNKVPLSKKTAEIVVKNINRMASEMGKDFSIDLDYLFMDTDDYNAEKDARFIIERLEKILMREKDYTEQVELWVKEVLIALKNPELKQTIYVLLGKIAKLTNDYGKQYYYFNEAFNLAFISKSFDVVLYCLEELQTICTANKYYSDLISLNKIVVEKIDSPTRETLVNSHRNIANAYLAMEQYEKAVNGIEQANVYIDDTRSQDALSNLLILGNSYQGMKMTDEAKNYYEKVMEIASSKNYTAIYEKALANLRTVQ